MTEDENNLHLLAIAHYVVGIIMAFFACLPLFHVGFGIAMLTGALPEPSNGHEEAFPTLFAWLFIIVGGSFFIFGQAVSIVVIVSGRFLKQRRGYLFSFIVACVMSTFVPLGTILGIFTIIVLSKDPVKGLYGRKLPATAVPPPLGS